MPAWFYVGDKLRSFHSWMRLVFGVSFGVVLIWISFTLIAEEMQHANRTLDAELERYFAPYQATNP